MASRRALPPSAVVWAVVAPLLLVAAGLSLLWWRVDLSACACELCPDGHCGYAARIHSALVASGWGAWSRLHRFAEHYLHAQLPLAAFATAITMFAVPSARASFVLVSVAATLLTFVVLLRTARSAWRLDRLTLVLLAVAFWSNTIIVRGFARPVSDAVGMACCVASLWAISRRVEQPWRGRSLCLLLVQLVGLWSRVSFMPMLGMPAAAELLGAAPFRVRVRRALAAGLLFGVLPLVAYLCVTSALGIDHTYGIWRWAHYPRFVGTHRIRDLAFGLWATGGAYLVLGLLCAARGIGTTPVQRLHLAWIALYGSFLVLGGGALWPRYFAPMVPSVLLVAAPGLAALTRRRALVACVAVATIAVLGWRTVLAHIGDPGAVLGQVVTQLRSGGPPRPVKDRMRALRRSVLRLSSDDAPDRVSAAADGDLSTSWRTSGPQREGTRFEIDIGRPRPIAMLRLLGDWGERPEKFVVEASADGDAWHELVARRELGDFVAAEATLVHLPGERMRYFRIRLVASARSPWSVKEVGLFVRPPGAAGGRAPGTPG